MKVFISMGVFHDQIRKFLLTVRLSLVTEASSFVVEQILVGIILEERRELLRKSDSCFRIRSWPHFSVRNAVTSSYTVCLTALKASVFNFSNELSDNLLGVFAQSIKLPNGDESFFNGLRFVGISHFHTLFSAALLEPLAKAINFELEVLHFLFSLSYFRKLSRDKFLANSGSIFPSLGNGGFRLVPFKIDRVPSVSAHEGLGDEMSSKLVQEGIGVLIGFYAIELAFHFIRQSD